MRLSPLRGLAAAVFVGLNTIFWCLPLFVLSLIKLCIPVPRVRAALDRALNALARAWVRCNDLWIPAGRATRWSVSGAEGLRPDGWTLVQANHQSWVDIFVLQHVLGPRLPLMKFFLKRELIYVPVIGLAWWALGFPFMQRKGMRVRGGRTARDGKVARAACSKFAATPTSIANFPEGTRATPAKQARQASPYRHLLQPRSGAVQAALEVLGPRLTQLVDVTIVYPAGVPTFWAFLCGRTPEVRVHVDQRPIPAALDAARAGGAARHRAAIQTWLQALWRDKDERIQRMLQMRPPPLANA